MYRGHFSSIFFKKMLTSGFQNSELRDNKLNLARYEFFWLIIFSQIRTILFHIFLNLWTKQTIDMYFTELRGREEVNFKLENTLWSKNVNVC